MERQLWVEAALLLSRVEARGGARLPWNVDWDRGEATLGPMEVSFYKLLNGGFSLGTYTRKDGYPDVERDKEIIEDAAYCIAEALQKKNPDFGPVTLFIHAGPAKGRVASQQLQKFPTARDAIRHVCSKIGSPGFHDPFITADSPTELLWDARELQKECERRTKAPPALHALADYVVAVEEEHTEAQAEGGRNPGTRQPGAVAESAGPAEQLAARLEFVLQLRHTSDRLSGCRQPRLSQRTTLPETAS